MDNFFNEIADVRKMMTDESVNPQDIYEKLENIQLETEKLRLGNIEPSHLLIRDKMVSTLQRKLNEDLQR